jgi:hypothetical protein
MQELLERLKDRFSTVTVSENKICIPAGKFIIQCLCYSNTNISITVRKNGRNETHVFSEIHSDKALNVESIVSDTVIGACNIVRWLYDSISVVYQLHDAIFCKST